MNVKGNEKCVLDLLYRLYRFSGDAKELASEGVILYRDELDKDLLPYYFDEIHSGEEVLVYFYSINEYVVYIITEAEEQEWLLVGILKRGELVYNFVPD